MTSQGYSKIYSFGHYEPTSLGNEFLYLQIQGDKMDKNHALEISADHLIYIQSTLTKSKLAIRAQDVKVGDTLITNDGPSEVLSIREVNRWSAYMPLTATGDILVNGVVASNYVWRSWTQTVHVPGQVWHWLLHGACQPYRAFCAAKGGCQDETYDEATGFSPWITFWFQLEQLQLGLPSLLQVLVLTVLGVLALLAIVAAKAVSAHLMLAGIGYVAWKTVEAPSKTDAPSVKKGI